MKIPVSYCELTGIYWNINYHIYYYHTQKKNHMGLYVINLYLTNFMLSELNKLVRGCIFLIKSLYLSICGGHIHSYKYWIADTA